MKELIDWIEEREKETDVKNSYYAKHKEIIKDLPRLQQADREHNQHQAVQGV